MKPIPGKDLKKKKKKGCLILPNIVQLNYEKFKKNVDKDTEVEDSDRPDRPAYVEVFIVLC